MIVDKFIQVSGRILADRFRLYVQFQFEEIPSILGGVSEMEKKCLSWIGT